MPWARFLKGRLAPVQVYNFVPLFVFTYRCIVWSNTPINTISQSKGSTVLCKLELHVLRQENTVLNPGCNLTILRGTRPRCSLAHLFKLQTFWTESPTPFVSADFSHLLCLLSPPPPMVRRLFHKRDTVTVLVSGRIDFRAKRPQFTFLTMMMMIMMIRISAFRFCFCFKEICFVLNTVLQQRVRSSFSSKEPCFYQR